jgi:hypothetical protein
MSPKSATVDAKTWSYTVLMVLVNESNMGIPISKDDQMSHPQVETAPGCLQWFSVQGSTFSGA